MKGFLVCIIGIDGAGKTTLARRLVSTLRKNGVNATYVWCGWRRFESFVLLPFAEVLRKFNDKSSSNKDSNRNSFVSTFKFKCGNLFEFLVIFDYLIKILLKVKIPLLLGKTVVCDRYIYDVVISLGMDLNYLASKIVRILEKYQRFTPSPTLIFLMDVQEEVAWKRKEDVRSPSLLCGPRSMLLSIRQKYRMVKLDGTRDLEEHVTFVKRLLFQSMIDRSQMRNVRPLEGR